MEIALIRYQMHNILAELILISGLLHFKTRLFTQSVPLVTVTMDAEGKRLKVNLVPFWTTYFVYSMVQWRRYMNLNYF